MITKKYTAITALVVCALALTTLGSAKNPVERPLKVKASATWVVNVVDGSAQVVQGGQATHLGLFTAEGQGNWDLQNFVILSGSGTVTAANRGEIYWEMGANNSVVFTGGTGRFAHVSGGFASVITAPPVISPGPSPGTIIMMVEYVGTGTITY